MANPHFTRIDTRLHRPVILGRDTCNGSCEQACGCLCIEQKNENQGRGPAPKHTGPRNKPSSAAKFIYRLVFAALGVALAVHFGLRLVAQVGPL